MATLQETFHKINTLSPETRRKLAISLIIILIGVACFWLGRLSSLYS